MLLRRPLFPGHNYMQQLHLIANLLGSSECDDLDFNLGDKVKQFLGSIPKKEGILLHHMFPMVGEDCKPEHY